MSWRETIARWICPKLGRDADRYHYLWHQVDDSHKWLSGYPDIKDAMQRLLEVDRDHWRALEQPATGKLPHEIWRFRDLLERRHLSTTPRTDTTAQEGRS